METPIFNVNTKFLHLLETVESLYMPIVFGELN